MSEIYRVQILEHYKNPLNRGSLRGAKQHHCEDNPNCGDRLCVDLIFDAAGKVKALAHSGQGCVISQAAASMMSDLVLTKKLTKAQILKLTVKDVARLLQTKISASREKCAMLFLTTLKNSLTKK